MENIKLSSTDHSAADNFSAHDFKDKILDKITSQNNKNQAVKLFQQLKDGLLSSNQETIEIFHKTINQLLPVGAAVPIQDISQYIKSINLNSNYGKKYDLFTTLTYNHHSTKETVHYLSKYMANIKIQLSQEIDRKQNNIGIKPNKVGNEQLKLNDNLQSLIETFCDPNNIVNTKDIEANISKITSKIHLPKHRKLVKNFIMACIALSKYELSIENIVHKFEAAVKHHNKNLSLVDQTKHQKTISKVVTVSEEIMNNMILEKKTRSKSMDIPHNKLIAIQHSLENLDSFEQLSSVKKLRTFQFNNQETLKNYKQSITLIWFLGGGIGNDIPQKYLESLETESAKFHNKKQGIKFNFLLDHGTFIKNQLKILSLVKQYGDMLEIEFVEDQVFKDKKIAKLHKDFLLQANYGNPALASDFYRLAINFNRSDKLKQNLYLDFDDFNNMTKESTVNKILRLVNYHTPKLIDEADSIFSSGNHLIMPLVAEDDQFGNNRLLFNLSKPNDLFEALKDNVINMLILEEDNVHKQMPQKIANKTGISFDGDLVFLSPGTIIRNEYKKISVSSGIVSDQNWTGTWNSVLMSPTHNIFSNLVERKETRNLVKPLNTIYSYNLVLKQRLLKPKTTQVNQFNTFQKQEFNFEQYLQKYSEYKSFKALKNDILELKKHAEGLGNMYHKTPLNNTIKFLNELCECNNSDELVNRFNDELRSVK